MPRVYPCTYLRACHIISEKLWSNAELGGRHITTCQADHCFGPDIVRLAWLAVNWPANHNAFMSISV
jgi:hypothetical protein